MEEGERRRSYWLPLLMLYLLYFNGMPLWGVAVTGLWYIGLLHLEARGISTGTGCRGCSESC